MDKQEYLNQISAANRPVNANKGGLSSIFSSKMFLYVGIFVIVLIAIIVFGSLIGGSKGDIKTKIISLKVHMDNTTEVVNSYQKNLKSSDLRSGSSSLVSVLTDGSRKLTDYITGKLQVKSGDMNKSLDKEKVNTLTQNKDTLSNDLFEAKINGKLDRVFSQKMTFETAILMNEEVAIIKATGSEELKSIVSENYDSLKTLYDKFNGFSEAK